MIITMRIVIKVNDNLSDKEINEILAKYQSVMPYRRFRANRVSDTWEFWL